MMGNNPVLFKEKVQQSLVRQANAINNHTSKGTYFFDYGNAFLLEASRAGAEVMSEDGTSFRYPSYVQDIDPCALITDLVLSGGFVLPESRTSAKQMKLVQ